MKILRNKQVGFIMKAEVTHLILIKMSSSTEMNFFFEEYHKSVIIKAVLFVIEPVVSCEQIC